MLVRPEALANAGGIGAIRNTMIDDCALAGIVKQSGGRIWLGLTTSTRSNRSYGSFAEIGRMISRTAFHQLKHSPLLLLGTILGLLVTYVLPLMFIVSGSSIAATEGALGWLVMSIAYLPMVRFYGRSWLWACALPPIACFYLCATVHSAVQYWRGKGGEWKGRAQDLRGVIKRISVELGRNRTFKTPDRAASAKASGALSSGNSAERRCATFTCRFLRRARAGSNRPQRDPTRVISLTMTGAVSTGTWP